MLEIHLRHLQYVAAVCKEHIPALTVFRQYWYLRFLNASSSAGSSLSIQQAL